MQKSVQIGMCFPHSKNKGFCVGRMSENCLKDLLIVGDNREKFRVPSLRQAFVFFKTQIGLQEPIKLSYLIIKLLLLNSVIIKLLMLKTMLWGRMCLILKEVELSIFL